MNGTAGLHEVRRRTDTSACLESLIAQFQKDGIPVDVDFRALVSWMKSGDQLTHQMHPYPAKLLANIAHFFINANSLAPTKSHVLDPFCGSGTVALEASLAGHIPYVADANPFALLLTAAKTTPFDVDGLTVLSKQLTTKARQYRSAGVIDVVNSALWFGSRVKLELERIARAIREDCPTQMTPFFQVCLSSTARRVSFADPAVSVPVRLKEKDGMSEARANKIRARIRWLRKVSVFDEFALVCKSNVARVQAANLVRPDRSAAILVGLDARHLDIEPPLPRANLIITSPPYGTAQKYVRASSLSLNILELTHPSELRAMEERSIGREHIWRDESICAATLPVSFQEFLFRTAKRNDKRAELSMRYLVEMRKALEEICKVLSPGGHLVIVTGNNEVCGETLRNDLFVQDVLVGLGMQLKVAMLDDIKSRGLMTKRNKTASTISRESVMVFQSCRD